MNILYITTIGDTMGFFTSFIGELLKSGYNVDVATNLNTGKLPDCYREWGCKVYPISCTRSPLNKETLTAIKEIRKIVREGDYDIVHCHTPIAAMCTRFACRKLRKNDLKVIYTAHGFHFYKGTPLKNWLLYYPVEWLCAHWTDTLITINREDYAFAQKHLHAKRVEYVPGVGIDVDKFANAVVDRTEKRREIGVPEDAFLLMSVGELNENKNHEVVLRALAQVGNKKIHYAIAGCGPLQEYLIKTAKELGISEQVHLLGQRGDVPELNKAADAFIHPSLREGLPVALMEAEASGLPCIVSRIRGNTDVVTEQDVLCNPHSVDQFAVALSIFYERQLGRRDIVHIRNFEISAVNKKLEALYHI